MIRRILPALLCIGLASALSANTIGPEMPLNYNALQTPPSNVRLNIGAPMIRLDYNAQVSPLHTTLMPAALEFGSMEVELESADGFNAPKSHLLDDQEASRSKSVAALIEGSDTERSIVVVIGLAMPSKEILADISRLSDSLETTQNLRFPAASVLSLALAQRS